MVAVFIPWLPEDASKQAGIVDSVYWVVTIICVVVFAVVAGVSAYAVYKFRPARRHGRREPIHGHTGLEIVWTLIPTILVTGIAIYSGVALAQSEDVPADHRTIEVSSQQFAWSFTYPDIEVAGRQAAHERRARPPIDQTVRFEITSKDVIHLLGAPVADEAGRGSGITTRTTVEPTLGDVPVICTELCGLGHATMRSQARVSPRRTTRRGSRSSSVLPAKEDPSRARSSSRSSAAAATLADAGTTGEVGPNLDEALQGADADFIMESIVDPSAEIAQGYQDAMPANFGELFTTAARRARRVPARGDRGGGR